MDDLKTTKSLVKRILEEIPETRNSDMFLYSRVCIELNDAVMCLPFGFVLLSMKELKLPGFETVRRSRQKVQEECPWLAACKSVSDVRAENEMAFREFARE